MRQEDVTIVFGNGFDLDLGLNTSYKSFVDSKDFEFWIKEYIDTPNETNLFDYIFKQRFIDTWGGVEASIYNVTYMPVHFIMCIERAEIPEGDCIF